MCICLLFYYEFLVVILWTTIIVLMMAKQKLQIGTCICCTDIDPPVLTFSLLWANIMRFLSIFFLTFFTGIMRDIAQPGIGIGVHRC